MPVGNKIPVLANKIQFHIRISMSNMKWERERERDASRGDDDGKCTFNNDGVQTVLHSATHSTCIVCNSNLMRTICAAVVMVFQSTARHSLTVCVCLCAKRNGQKTAIKMINFCVSFYYFKVFASDRPTGRTTAYSLCVIQRSTRRFLFNKISVCLQFDSSERYVITIGIMGECC